MAINEIFPNPTVKQVIFQIKFPNLFYLESKIGDFQTKILSAFPESALLFKKKIIFAELGPQGKIDELQGSQEDQGNKVWQFKAKNGAILNILNSSLDISSSFHKTYNLGAQDKFRDLIEFVLTQFFSVIQVPIIIRVGLRYIDECPIIKKENEEFKKWYNTTFCLDRFNLKDAIEMDYKGVINKGKYVLKYIESLKKVDEKKEEYELILDFDAFAFNIEPGNYLAVTDDLHALISTEFENTIQEPLKKFMREAKK